MDNLKEQVMVSQFMLVAGCHAEQARKLLSSAKWHYETALSMFFQECAIPPCRCCEGCSTNCHYPTCAPANTPVTPPMFPDTLLAFSSLSTNENAATAKIIQCAPSHCQAGITPSVSAAPSLNANCGTF